uniref:PHD-type domain-containing protein n=1 Tax=Astyanax mexicanus TaxID=7994 RepID=A0A3B1JB96_ASTMX
MEENVGPELAQVPEPEARQDPLDAISQAPTTVLEEEKEDKDQGNAAQEDRVEDPEKSKTSGEFKKTWGFRRTTIAQRDMPGETAAESPDAKGAPVRRSGRQAKRTDKLEEFLVTVKRGRGGGRRSAPLLLEGGDPPSQTPTDAETASEASFDGNAEAKAAENKAPSPAKKTRGRKKAAAKAKTVQAGSHSDDASSENEEEAGEEISKVVHEEVVAMVSTEEEGKMEDSVNELKPEQEAVKQDKDNIEKENKDKPEEEAANRRPTRSPARAAGKELTPAKREVKPKAGAKSRKGQEEEEDDEDEDDESSSSESDSDGYDPNALYCICRQKHNKRFMICCDRCEEWFHGDCVGITEARGRLMERNGEDYVCPNCTGKKVQTSKPAPSTAATENGKRLVPPVRKAEPSPAPVSQPTTPSTSAAVSSAATITPSTPSAAPSTGEKPGEDLGIKGRIEKATNPSGKKKIKIFQPQAIVSPEESSLPKCIGPGCERDALPDSVYCGNDCILKHAAAAMKTITTENKEPKTKEKTKTKTQKKTPAKSTPKKNAVPERRSSRRSTESSSKAEEESSESEAREHEEEEDEEDKLAEEHPPPPAMSSWSSDHNYIAVTPEKTTPISPTVLNKACMYLFEGFPHFYGLFLCFDV